MVFVQTCLTVNFHAYCKIRLFERLKTKKSYVLRYNHFRRRLPKSVYEKPIRTLTEKTQQTFHEVRVQARLLFMSKVIQVFIMVASDTKIESKSESANLFASSRFKFRPIQNYKQILQAQKTRYKSKLINAILINITD